MDEKLRTLEGVLAKVAHDLRTPLAVVHTTANMLLNPKYQLTADQVRAQHERIRRNAEIMNRMIGELSDVAQIRSGALTLDTRPTDVDEVLREALAANQDAAREKGLTVSCEADDEAKNAEADRARLLQMFAGLLGHAVRASDAGSSIIVRSALRDGDAHVEIIDRAREVSPAELPGVFDPWRSGGSLGLFISKGIVEAHGGRIRCDSQPGVGTTFFVTLPLARFSA